MEREGGLKAALLHTSPAKFFAIFQLSCVFYSPYSRYYEGNSAGWIVAKRYFYKYRLPLS